jgi:hypothetical protein
MQKLRLKPNLLLLLKKLLPLNKLKKLLLQKRLLKPLQLRQLKKKLHQLKKLLLKKQLLRQLTLSNALCWQCQHLVNLS